MSYIYVYMLLSMCNQIHVLGVDSEGELFGFILKEMQTPVLTITSIKVCQVNCDVLLQWLRIKSNIIPVCNYLNRI